jgi:hypothetical protein
MTSTKGEAHHSPHAHERRPSTAPTHACCHAASSAHAWHAVQLRLVSTLLPAQPRLVSLSLAASSPLRPQAPQAPLQVYHFMGAVADYTRR